VHVLVIFLLQGLQEIKGLQASSEDYCLLKKQLAEAERQKDEAISKLEHLEAQQAVPAVSSSLETTPGTAAHAETDSAVRELRSSIKSMKKEAVRKQAEHEAVVAEHEKKYNELLATLQQERQEHEAKQHSLSASASSEEQLADSVRQLQDELAALKKSHDEASGVASDLQSALDDARGKLAESQALVKAKDAALSSLQARLSEVAICLVSDCA
jgi:nucleoprotein TPR